MIWKYLVVTRLHLNGRLAAFQMRRAFRTAMAVMFYWKQHVITKQTANYKAYSLYMGKFLLALRDNAFVSRHKSSNRE